MISIFEKVRIKILENLKEKSVFVGYYKNVKIEYKSKHVSDRWIKRVSDTKFKFEYIEKYIKRAIDKFNAISKDKLKLFSEIGRLSITIIPKSASFKLAGSLYQKNDNNVTLVIDTILDNKQVSKDTNNFGWIIYTETIIYKNNEIIIYV